MAKQGRKGTVGTAKIEVFEFGYSTGAHVTFDRIDVEVPGVKQIAPCGLLPVYEPMVAQGMAHTSLGDEHDPEIGAQLAVARALQSAAARIRRQALGQLKHKADMIEQRKVQASTKQAKLAAHRQRLAEIRRADRQKQLVLTAEVVDTPAEAVQA